MGFPRCGLPCVAVPRSAMLLYGSLVVSACGGGAGGPSGPDLPSDSPSTTATLVVTATIMGSPIDPDGYAILVDGVSRGCVPSKGTATLTGLSAGAHTVTLDGAWAFCAFDGGTGRRAYDLNLVASQQTTLTAAVTCTPKLRNRIIFASNRTAMPQSDLGLWAMHPDGSGQTLLSATEGGVFLGASLDGSRLAFIRTTNVANGIHQHLWLMNVDGSGADEVFTTDTLPTTPQWSPDGSWIALARGGAGDMWLMHPDGTGETRLASNGYPEADPSWSPDGTRLAYSHFVGLTGDIYVMNADGTNRVQLTYETAGYAITPAWSPDGTKIAFSTNRTGVYQIWVMKADGTEQTRLTQSTTYETNPVWSPDGSKIAWVSERSGDTQDIWIMDADGKNQISLTAGHGANVSPTWTR